MGENPGVLLGISQWRNSITLVWITKFHTMFMGECKTTVHGDTQPTLGVQGIRNSYWQEIAFGDGFDVVPDLDDSRFGYAMSQQGYVSRYDWKTGNNYSVRPTHPDPDVRLRFNWNAAIGQDPFDNSTVYFGSQFA